MSNVQESLHEHLQFLRSLYEPLKANVTDLVTPLLRQAEGMGSEPMILSSLCG